MKINISKIVRKLDLGEYAEEFKGQVAWVWVNPDLATVRKREALIDKYNRLLNGMLAIGKKAEENGNEREKLAEQAREQIEAFNTYAMGDFINGINEWFALLWSQAADASTHWTVPELNDLNNTDPALYQWMQTRTIEMIDKHRAHQKKD